MEKLLLYPANLVEIASKLLRIELTMKFSLVTTLACLTVACAALGQVPNRPAALKTEIPEIVAEVNGDRITRTSLAAECLQLHGEKELFGLINMLLIRLECERQNIVITAEEINAELLRWAQAANLSTEHLLKTIEFERNVPAEQLRQGTVWRTLALRKIAGTRLNPSAEELQTAYDAKYGSAIRARQIVLASQAEAEAVLAELRQYPETFATVAKNKSIDLTTQPYGGMLFPIRRHSMHPNVENILFSLKEGELSPIFEMMPGQFTIYRCEGYLEPVDIDVEAAKRELFFQLRDAKQLQITGEVFNELRNRAQVNIIFGNPALYGQYPGVAALVNGREVSIKELADTCVQKHGAEVVDDMILRLIVEQACRRANIQITDQDIDKEIWEMAFEHLPLLQNGEPNIALWQQKAAEEEEMSIPMYRKNVVVPMLALKRLTQPITHVTEEDILRSFEASFGNKVRCRAIFFEGHDDRRAHEAWQAANRHNTEENFGDLAKKYSLDPESRSGRGVIPLIAQHCGQPIIEKAAFALKPGELSEMLHVDGYIVILYCVEHIARTPVEIEKVRGELIADLFKKKQKIIIAREFERLYNQAVWMNHLTNTSQNPALGRAQQEEPIQQR